MRYMSIIALCCVAIIMGGCATFTGSRERHQLEEKAAQLTLKLADKDKEILALTNQLEGIQARLSQQEKTAKDTTGALERELAAAKGRIKVLEEQLLERTEPNLK